MHSSYNLNYRHSGRNLSVSLVRPARGHVSFFICGDRRNNENTADQRRIRPQDCGGSLGLLCRLLLLSLSLAVAPIVTFAGEPVHDHGNVNDPTGTWLIRDGEGLWILMNFHAGGTLTGDFQGESAFGPPPFNIIVTPQSGVWQKTGAKTFAVTFVSLEYQVSPPDAPIYQIDKSQLTGVLSDSGNQMQLTALSTAFNPDGSQKGDSFADTANGIRIPLEVLPNTSHSLPIPVQPL